MVDEDWLRRALHGPVDGLRSWTPDRWEGGVRLTLLTARGEVGIDLETRRAVPAYATTPSMSAYLRHDGAIDPGVEAVARAVIARLREADPGGLTVAKGAAIHDPSAPPVDGPVVDERLAWLRLARELPAQLEVAAALAWHAHARGEAYPFPSLGVPDPEPLRAWWLARWPRGVDRDLLEEAWGGDAGPRVMAMLAELRGLGVVRVEDDRIDAFAGTGADPWIWAVWLWAPEVRDAAVAAWGVDVPDARARLDAAVGGAHALPAPR